MLLKRHVTIKNTDVHARFAGNSLERSICKSESRCTSDTARRDDQAIARHNDGGEGRSGRKDGHRNKLCNVTTSNSLEYALRSKWKKFSLF